MVQGRVKCFNDSKVYEFIGRKTGPDVFVHCTLVVGPNICPRTLL